MALTVIRGQGVPITQLLLLTFFRNQNLSSDSVLIKRSLLISFSGRYLGVFIQFVSIMLLSRLLTPAEIGIYTVSAAVISMAHMVRDFGISQYLIQEKDLNREKAAAALGLTYLVAWSLGILVYAAAPHIAAYYDENLIESVVHVVGFNFFIIPIGAMAPSLLRRSMSFGTLLKINLSTTLVNATLVVLLAYMGFGVMSMAWASLAGTCVAAGLGQYYLPSGYRVFPSLRNSRSVLSFGSFFLGSNMATELGTSIPDMIIGRVLGFAPLGLFSRAGGYLKIYTSLVSRASYPVVHAYFAKVNRKSGEVADSYLRTLDLITLVGWTLLSFMALMSTQLIYVLYGNQWLDAAPVASVMCAAFMLAVVSQINDQLLVATGHVRPIFAIATISNAVKISIVAVLAGEGLVPVAFGIASAILLQFLLTATVTAYAIKIPLRPVIGILFRNFGIVFIAMAVPFYYFHAVQTAEISVLRSILELSAAAAYSFTALITMVFVFGHVMKDEIITTFLLVRKKLTRA